MNGKITLVTPPDIFENSNVSMLFVHLTESDQDIVSQWLAESNVDQDINIYVFNGEPNVPWLLYALNFCEYTYVNVDHVDSITTLLNSYMLGKSNVHYSTANEQTAHTLSYINRSRYVKVTDFLERVFEKPID